MRTGQAHGAIQFARLTRREAHTENAAGKRGEHLPAKGDPVTLVFHRGDPGVEVQPAAVVGGLVLAGKLDPQITARLVGFLPEGKAHELLHAQVLGLLLPGGGGFEQFLRFLLFGGGGLGLAGGAELVGLFALLQPLQLQRAALEQQAAHFGQGPGRVRVRVRVRFSRPDGVLIELEVFGGHAAIDHGPEMAVADGERHVPLPGGLAVPQAKRGRRGGGGPGQCGGFCRRRVGARRADPGYSRKADSSNPDDVRSHAGKGSEERPKAKG